MISILESLFLGLIASLAALFAEALAFTLVTWNDSPWTFNYDSLLVSSKFILAFVAIEEIAKFFFISKQIVNFPSKWLGTFHAAVIGLGFAGIESLIVYQRLHQSLTGYWLPVSGIFMVHVMTSFILGVFLAQRWKLWITAPIALAITIGLHFAYNLNVMAHLQ